MSTPPRKRAKTRPDAPRLGTSARTLLIIILAKYVLNVLPFVWTNALIDALRVVGIDEGTARQALRRAAAEGIIESERVGRRMRWRITADGGELLQRGLTRTYGFEGPRSDWNGRWLLLMVTVSENQRDLRHELRRRLSGIGFSSLKQGVWISPDVNRESEARSLLKRLGLEAAASSFVAHHGNIGVETELLRNAWDVDDLNTRYDGFIEQFSQLKAKSDQDAFAYQTLLIHEWRRFPFIDSGLPTRLLPVGWAGAPARVLFYKLRERWDEQSSRWFASLLDDELKRLV